MKALVAVLCFGASCGPDDLDQPRPEPRPSIELPSTAAPDRPAARSASPASADASAGASRGRRLSDRDLGRLIVELSEETGEFPSENLVSNETTYLDVAPLLRDAALRGRAYVGVGPEQNLTYFALLQPEIAFVVDIRRENLLEHLVLRAAIEAADTPGTFLAKLTARPAPASSDIEDVVAFLGAARSEPDLLAASLDRTTALATRLGLDLDDPDRAAIRAIHQAFFDRGLDATYSMEGSRRRYPTLAELVLQRDPDGRLASFVADAEAYRLVRAAMRENRIVPVAGDFAGTRALAGVARRIREMGLTLGVFYASNVEEYLLPGEAHARFLDNLRAMPMDARSLVVRVWFDRWRPHPRQREGHRMTTLAVPLQAFLARAAERPFRSYWQVVQWPEP
ncbi:MAG: hypothetical protein HYY06_01375 [Deltaproteobacteria bacterium]|nr:hypothetical protein [Deltaproteobacteria bacterium]